MFLTSSRVRFDKWIPDANGKLPGCRQPSSPFRPQIAIPCGATRRSGCLQCQNIPRDFDSDQKVACIIILCIHFPFQLPFEFMPRARDSELAEFNSLWSFEQTLSCCSNFTTNKRFRLLLCFVFNFLMAGKEAHGGAVYMVVVWCTVLEWCHL